MSYRIIEIVDYSAELLIVIAGLIIVMASGGIDISIGGQISVSIGIMCWAYKLGIPVGAVIIIGILTGAICGTVIGIIISYMHIHPFIATMAMNFIYAAVARYLFSGNVTFAFEEVLISFFEAGRWLLRAGMIIGILCIAFTFIVINRTYWGRYVVASGINSMVAENMGIKVTKIKFSCYVICGIFSGVASIVQFGSNGLNISFIDTDVTLCAITAIYMGNAMILYDKTHISKVGVWKSAAAAVFLVLLHDMLTDQFGGKFIHQIVTSILLLLILTFDRYRRKDGLNRWML